MSVGDAYLSRFAGEASINYSNNSKPKIMSIPV